MSAELANLSVYNAGMKKSMMDKMFFIDKVDAHVFIDYGCADGTLIQFLRGLFPEFTYIGFDISPDMIQLARIKNPEIASYFTSDWNTILDLLPALRERGKVAVLLSSIIHEVYSYGTGNDVETFWDRIFHDGFDYIVVRDMMPSISVNRQADINDIAKVYRKADKEKLYEFQQTWGSIENNKSMIHWFLKYRYDDNWEREVKENYLPMNREQFLSMLPDNYDITFHEHFILPYLLTQVQKDFGIVIKDNTHLKLILRKA